MELYLMQHGLSLAKEQDLDQPLSPQGRVQVEAAARAAQRLGLKFDKIFHSAKERSRLTAQILAQGLGLGPEVMVETDLVKPMTPAAETVVFLQGFRDIKSACIAGHLPSLAAVASFLLGRGAMVPIRFENAGLMCLDCPDLIPGGGELQWYLRPSQLALLAAG